MNFYRRHRHDKKNDGVTAIIVGVVIVLLLGFTALAVDIGHLYVVRNELQNASDAGALAGARSLYYVIHEDGTEEYLDGIVNAEANQTAFNAATANKSERTAVDINWTAGNEGDIQRGHWCFSCTDAATGKLGVFTPNEETAAYDLQAALNAGLTAEDLDPDTDLVNAVRVTARRQGTPAASYFARIFGFEGFTLSTTSVAYIGFAGNLEPGAMDQPIGICKQSLIDADGGYTCGVGRFINSGQTDGHQTGGWTNFTQPCETASTPTVKPLVCESGNPEMVMFGSGIGTTGGMEQSVYDSLINCWKNSAGLDTDGDGWPDKSWMLTLPVIDCPGNNTSPCSKLVGAAELRVVWIVRNDKNQYKEVPQKMDDWSCPVGYTGPQCWDSFAAHFKLKDVLNNTPAFYEDKTIYFLPDCTTHAPTGGTGGEFYGIWAKYPVLVK